MRYSEIHNGYDLKSKYKEFNLLYFENALPDIPVVFSDKMKGKSGVAHCQIIRTSPPRRGDKYYGCVVKPGTLNIKISSIFKRTDDEISKILLHEMIHIFFFTVGNRLGENHGYYFQKMVDKISRESGLKIPLIEPVDGTEELASSITKTIGVMILNKADGTTTFCCLKADTARNISKDTLEQIYNNWSRMYKITSAQIYLVNSPIWATVVASYPLKRIPGSGSMYKPSNENIITDLKENGKIISQYP